MRNYEFLPPHGLELHRRMLLANHDTFALVAQTYSFDEGSEAEPVTLANELLASVDGATVFCPEKQRYELGGGRLERHHRLEIDERKLDTPCDQVDRQNLPVRFEAE